MVCALFFVLFCVVYSWWCVYFRIFGVFFEGSETERSDASVKEQERQDQVSSREACEIGRE